MDSRQRESMIGCLLGTAAGDALGLPFEGLSARRARRWLPEPARHRLVFGRGMVSDDTEHAAFAAQALIRSGGDVERFRHDLARSLRWWLASLPPGIGFATLRSIVKLWLGWRPDRSGVYSAGNGPAMRSAILGVAFGHDPDQLEALVRASTGITHSDPKARFAALAVALAAADPDPARDADWRAGYLRSLERRMSEASAAEFRELAAKAMQSAERDESVTQFAESIGSNHGISGYCYHTVPCVLQVWFRFGDDLERGLPAIIRAGGDTDTAGAIFGAIAGARAGRSAIPGPWLSGIADWPRSVAWLERLGDALARRMEADGAEVSPPAYCWPAVLPRNLVLLIIVLAHGFRRLLPPY